MSKRSIETASPPKSPATEITPLVGKNGFEPEAGGSSGVKLSNGLSVFQATLLIAGEMAGSGVLALPRAMVKTGWIGVFLMIALCAMAAFSGKRLADCWTIIETRNPGMRTRQRNPYAIIAHQALGKTWSAVVSVSILVTLVGAAVVYLLMAAQIIQEIFLSLITTISYCSWFLLITATMAPLMMLGTPKDFSLMGFIALVSSIVACILFLIQMIVDIRPYPTFRYGTHGFQDFFLAFGTFMFAFGGASTFPTIQNDMEDKTKFGKCVAYSFTGILCLYLPIAVMGYLVYGDAVAPNFAASLSPTAITLAGNILMALHLVSAFIIIINPVCQEMEELCDTPRDSLKWRLGIRMAILFGILFIGETIPRFHTILAFVGGTTIALLTFILPSYCYMKLTDQSPADVLAPLERPRWMSLVCWEAMLVGIMGGLSAAVSSLVAIFSTSQAKPCYIK